MVVQSNECLLKAVQAQVTNLLVSIRIIIYLTTTNDKIGRKGTSEKIHKWID